MAKQLVLQNLLLIIGPAGSVGLGWKKNMEELANTLVGSKMNFDETKIVLDENSKTWKFDKFNLKQH